MFEDAPRGSAEPKDGESRSHHGLMSAQLKTAKEQEQKDMSIPSPSGPCLGRLVHQRSNRRQITTSVKTGSLLLSVLAATTLPGAMAQSCISLANSTQCPAFNASSISTDSTLTGLLYVPEACLGFTANRTDKPAHSSFLSNVTDTASFDTSIQEYIAGDFSQQR